MQDKIQSIIEWNKKANNNGFNKHLEASMLAEEFAETIVAIKNWDKVEAIDWILDIFWVGIWTLHKMWIDAETINKCFEEIEKSNYSKFVNWKAMFDETWKIQKPKTYFKPDLNKFIN